MSGPAASRRAAWAGCPLWLGPLAAAAFAATTLGAIGTGELLATPWPLVLLRDAALVSCVVLAAGGLGRFLAAPALRSLTALEGQLGGIAIGLGAFALAVLGLGLASVLDARALTALIVAGLALAMLPSRRRAPRPVPPDAPPKWAGRLLVAAALVPVAAALSAVVTPEVFFDALQYHDALPAHFLRQGRVEPLRSMLHGVMPANAHMLYVPLSAWGGTSTIKLAHWLFWLGGAAWARACAMRVAGRVAGAAAAAAVLGVPGMAVMAGFGGIDHAVTFFVLAGVTLTVAAVESSAAPVLVASGALLGVAAGAKYTALPALALWGAGAGVWWARRRRETAHRWRPLALALAASVAVACPWYLRNWAALGSPVYPLGAGSGSEGEAIVARVRADAAPPGDWWQAPLDIVAALGELRPTGAGGETLPVGALLAAALVWGLSQRGGSRWVACFALGLLAAWSRGALILRYAYPALALGAVLAGVAVARRRSRTRMAGAVAVLVGLVLAGAVRAVAIQGALLGDRVAFLAGHEDGRAYLARHVPGFGAAMWVRGHTPEAGTRLLLVGETASTYFGRDFVPVSAYNRHPMADWLQGCERPADLAEVLRGRGLTHVVLNPTELQRLQARYGHLPLGAREADVLRGFLAGCPRLFDDGTVAVLAVPPPSSPQDRRLADPAEAPRELRRNP